MMVVMVSGLASSFLFASQWFPKQDSDRILYYFNDGKSAPEKQLNLDRVYQITDNSINLFSKNP